MRDPSFSSSRRPAPPNRQRIGLMRCRSSYLLLVAALRGGLNTAEVVSNAAALMLGGIETAEVMRPDEPSSAPTGLVFRWPTSLTLRWD
jgi:hypothetical protein